MNPLLLIVYLVSFISVHFIGSDARHLTRRNEQSIVRYYELNVTQNSYNPDCSEQYFPAFLLNGQLPGPKITANQGDIVQVLVRNQLSPLKNPLDPDHSVSIHFHGIRQYGSVDSDGVPYLTQSPILPGEEFLYEFRVVYQSGTYFYHAHVGLQEETVFGPLIIYESEEARPQVPENTSNERTPSLWAGPFCYDEERVLLLSEWWHRSHLDLEKFIMGPTFEFLPEAESVLINGRTLYDPENIMEKNCAGYEVVPVKPNKTYRLRVIGATTFRTLGFAIAHHNLTIIEVDGEFVKPYTVHELEVTPGQRFSVLLHTDQDADDYSIQVVRRWADTLPRATNGLAVLQYDEEASYENRQLQKKNDPEVEDRGILRIKNPIMLDAPEKKAWFKETKNDKPYWLWPHMEPLHGVDPIVYRPASQTIKLRSVDQRLPDNTTRWLVNGVAFTENHQGAPILQQIQKNERPIQLKSATTIDGYDSNLGTYPIQHFDIVDLVFQTTHIPGEPCRSHPWHTHGHSHWEIAHGSGEYIEERDGDIRNVKTPLLKDITLVYPSIDPELSNVENNPEPVGCGWSKVRILADNPGIWAVHCHNTPHMLMGMMIALEEASELIPRYRHSGLKIRE